MPYKYLEEKRDYEQHKRHTSYGRAVRFLQSNPDCTSSLKEIEEIYRAGIDMTTGQVGRVGRGPHDLCLDHIKNGPAIGLIPGWLNHITTRHVNGNRETIVRYWDLREKVENEPSR